MINHDLFPFKEQLDRIEKKVDGKYSNKFLDINQVVHYASLSESTIRRAIKKGVLKVSRSTGKLLFKTEWVDKWLNG